MGVGKPRSFEAVIDISSSADNGAFPQSYARDCADSIVIVPLDPGNSEHLSPLLPRSRTIMWHHPWQRCRTRQRVVVLNSQEVSIVLAAKKMVRDQ